MEYKMKKIILTLFMTILCLSNINSPVVASTMPPKIIMFETNGERIPVYQQPLNQPSYVTEIQNQLNQVWSERISGKIIFAHNYLAGEIFLRMQALQIITITYSTGQKVDYIVAGFKKVQRHTTTMLNNPDYNNPDILVMQTCIDNSTAILVIAYKIGKQNNSN
jgi:hypothetical protein